MFATITSVFRGFLFNWAYHSPTASKLRTNSVEPPVAVASQTDDDAPDQSDTDTEVEDRLTAWEQERAATLTEAADSEKDGMHLLTRAALLRMVVHFEDEGLFVVAHELQQKADALKSKPALVTEQTALTDVPF